MEFSRIYASCYLPVISTYIEPESIRHWMFLLVLQRVYKDFKNSELIPLGIVCGPSFNKLESSSHKNALYQI